MTGDKKSLKRDAMAKVYSVERILRIWDPIGVLPNESGPADEYDSYAPHIVTLVIEGCSLDELAAHLEKIRTQKIGLPKRPERDRKVASQIIRELRAMKAV